MLGCVFLQVAEGAEGNCGGLGGGRERDDVLVGEPAGQDGRAADGGAVDAEEARGDGLDGQAQVVAEAGDRDVVGDVDAAVAVRPGAADGVGPAAAAPDACRCSSRRAS